MKSYSTATVHNSVAYRSLGLEFELWSFAATGVTSLYLQHFECLLSTSKHARYNVLRTFQKSTIVRKLLYALRSGMFNPGVVPAVVGQQLIGGVNIADCDDRHPAISADRSMERSRRYQTGSILSRFGLVSRLAYTCRYDELTVSIRQPFVFHVTGRRSTSFSNSSIAHTLRCRRAHTRSSTPRQAAQVHRIASPASCLHF